MMGNYPVATQLFASRIVLSYIEDDGQSPETQ
jgi:hypothetical protein